ncbi:MAG: integrase arm-type DNA-binding domain-containing protein [Proteobacteria bacterium]|nr:integrase arm-type DNA-binding domain-containing protein [Pseudomonadota bacterium]
MALTNTSCKQAKAGPENYKLYDEKGLYLLVDKSGRKYWRQKYRYANKEKLLAHGVYPEVSLKDARDKTLSARKLLADGIDPSAERKARKQATIQSSENSFEVIALEWFAKEQIHWSPAHIKKQKGLLENNLLPYLGKLPISETTPTALLDCLRKIESRGALETTRRAKQVTGQIFRYAIATGRADRDPSADLRGALKTPKTSHFAAITEPQAFGALIRAIDSFQGTRTVAAALKLAPMLFVRPGELRHMEWTELEFDKCEWLIPAEKMKMREAHIVPLSHQAVAILQELKPLTGRWQFVFPGERSRRLPMSNNTMNAALRRLGYSKEEVTAHGFRASARTLLDEVLGFEPHLIEHQLSHEVRDSLGRAYNRTKHLKQRKEMMQIWSDYIEKQLQNS